MPFWIHFVSIFDIAFCMRFGKHFDRIPDRNWIQKGSQYGSRIYKKIDFSARVPFQAFLDNFGNLFDPIWSPFGSNCSLLVAVLDRFGSIFVIFAITSIWYIYFLFDVILVAFLFPVCYFWGPMWELCGNHVGTMREPCGNHLGTIWEPRGNLVGTMRELCGNYVGTMWGTM